MYRIGRRGCRYWPDGGGDGDCDEGSDGKVGRSLSTGRGGASVTQGINSSKCLISLRLAD